jgi:hypothetical protein
MNFFFEKKVTDAGNGYDDGQTPPKNPGVVTSTLVNSQV